MLSRFLFPGLILMIFVVLLIDGSLELSADSMIFPMITGGFASFLLLWELVREVREVRRGTSMKTQGKTSFKQIGTYLSGFAWVLAILPMIYLLGFLIAIPLYLFSYMKLQGEKWLLCITIASLAEILFYFVFVVALEISFYNGLLFEYIMS